MTPCLASFSRIERLLIRFPPDIGSIRAPISNGISIAAVSRLSPIAGNRPIFSGGHGSTGSSSSSIRSCPGKWGPPASSYCKRPDPRKRRSTTLRIRPPQFAASVGGGVFQYVRDDFTYPFDLFVAERRVGKKHQAGLAELQRVRQALRRSPRRPVERLLEINFRAAALVQRHAARHDFCDDPIPVPIRSKPFGAHIGVKTIISVLHPYRPRTPNGPREGFQHLCEARRAFGQASRPGRHPAELDWAYRRLYPSHAPVRAYTFS